MKFVFLAVDCTPFHAKSLEERPLGGTVTGVIRIAECLHALGHEVIVATPHNSPPPSIPKYLPLNQLSTIGACDVFIVIRNWKYLYNIPFTCKKRFYWTGDSYDFPGTIGIGDPRFYREIDGLLLVSRWQAETLCSSSGFPIVKTWVLQNGIHISDFSSKEQKHRKRLIYSSLPHRGLVYLPRIFSEIKKIHPDAELHIYGSFERNSPNWMVDNNGGEITRQLKELGGEIHGSIPQKQLAREFMQAAILAYPCCFEETSCITAMEAQAAGCAIVTTDIGALKETVGEAGILIHEKPGSEEYYKKYIAAVDLLLSDDEIFKTLSQNGLERAKRFTWEKAAQNLLEYLRIFHRLI